MRPTWVRWQKRIAVLACGGITCGWLQGLSMVNFADLLTSFLTYWLSLIVAALFGGDVSQYFGQTT